eukprot:1772596-Prorocentrum_lima.AAC.1
MIGAWLATWLVRGLFFFTLWVALKSVISLSRSAVPLGAVTRAAFVPAAAAPCFFLASSLLLAGPL